MAFRKLQFHLLLVLLVAELASGLWWSLGTKPILDHGAICRAGRRLKGQQRQVCKKEKDVFSHMVEGSRKAMAECQFQFQNHRWNCSDGRRSLRRVLLRDTRETAILNAIVAAGVTHKLTEACSRGDLIECSCRRENHHHLSVQPKKKKSKGEKKRKKPKRVRGPSDKNRISPNALPSGGVPWRGTGPGGGSRRKRPGRSKQRRDGSKKLVKERQTNYRYNRLEPLGPSYKSEGHVNNIEQLGITQIVPAEKWAWSGCSDDVEWGAKKSEAFMDRRYKKGRRDPRTIVMLWNNNAGRMAVKDHLRKQCKCHGLSGSCSHATCWKRLPTFRNVGAHLLKRYHSAVKVISNNDAAKNDATSIQPSEEAVKEPTVSDLVFLDHSPDYCRPNRRSGSLGTVGRICNATSNTHSGCDVLCCGRGHYTKEEMVKEPCKCRFEFCCKVTCQTCEYLKETTHCN